MSRRPTTDELGELVLAALRDLAATMPEVDGLGSLGLDAPLFGQDGLLDSLGLVNLVVLTERKVEDAYGVEISLADEAALAMDENPFRTPRAFAALTARLVARATGATGATG